MKRIDERNVVFEFSPKMKPVKKVSSGEVVKFGTKDCFSNQITSEDETIEEIDFSEANPATGPIEVVEADAGDYLKVDILDIELPDYGITVIAPDEGVLGDEVEKSQTFLTEIMDNYAFFRGSKIEINPMIGVIGVASSSDTYNTGSQWKHGGNMDTTKICPGSSVIFPVNQEGGMLALGDCHASMGDGEVCVSGLEISSEALTKVEVIEKDLGVDWPLVENNDSYSIIASGENLENAVKNAVKESVKLLSKTNDLSWEEAYALNSLEVDLEFSQVVDPNKTVRATIPKYLIEEGPLAQ